ncbi:MAG: hypothetical protein AAGK77_03145 [Pseudomonadota bacterium]
MERAVLSMILAAAATSAALAETVCMDAAEMEASLIDWYGEAPVRGAKAKDQQLWASDATGTWTLMQLNSDGTACVLGQGQNWSGSGDPLVALRRSLDKSDGAVTTEVTAFMALLSADRQDMAARRDP